uniref:Avidin n=1 Tax=Octopus bimaculoides TaxID=37653 RepID=A0A0L8I521_OCTBM
MLAWFSNDITTCWLLNTPLWVLFLLFGRCSAYGKQIENCATLQGVWYNQLGSQLILSGHKHGTLEGEYRTSVEVELGDAGHSHSIVVGTAPKSPGAAFGFSVVWRHGRSTTVWTGQCVVCLGGHEKLLTTWLLHSQASSCDDKWKSDTIGRDIFTRYEQKPGPRKEKNTHVPERPANYTSSSDKSMKPLVKLSNLPEPATPPCKLEGTWYNELGSEVILKQNNAGIIKGEFRTAVERSPGAAGNTHSLVHGIANFHEPNSTFGFHVVWRNGESVTGFVGQCHSTCALEQMDTLEITWILWQSIDKCQDHWKSTLYGVNTFTRYEQAAGLMKYILSEHQGQLAPSPKLPQLEKKGEKELERNIE